MGANKPQNEAKTVLGTSLIGLARTVDGELAAAHSLARVRAEERDDARADVERLRAEVERLRAQQPDAELVERARDFVAPNAHWACDGCQSMALLRDLLGHLDAPEAAHEADEPQTWRERAQELEAEVERLRARVAELEARAIDPALVERARALVAKRTASIPRSPAPFRYRFGVCPACGGTLAPPDWTDAEWLRHGYRRCSECKRLVVPAREGRIIEEATP